MHYVTRRSHRMQEHKFSVTCPSLLFAESEPVLREHEKLCADVSCPGRTGMNRVIRISHHRQKHNFDRTCSSAFFVEFVTVPPELEK
jgi:hypothetical protein